MRLASDARVIQGVCRNDSNDSPLKSRPVGETSQVTRSDESERFRQRRTWRFRFGKPFRVLG